MPKRKDIKSIMLIGSGPIIIGQACEFDYSGTQALKALKEEGFRVVLVNSNPATIMTDPEFADATYIEPLKLDVLANIIAKERPDALLPTLGGQTALNRSVELHEAGVLEKYGVELIGAGIEAINKAEDREQFKVAMSNIGLDLPKSGYAESLTAAWRIARQVGFPNVIRPSFTLGGTGGSIAFNEENFERLALLGLEASPVNRILVEESVLGWKEFELEVMRDVADNVVIICSIENFDPMGVHTGDSITVAPAQTLTDKEYQILRDQSVAIIREIGVDTGGSNIQFAVHPDNGRVVVIEMNPRVSRSSALASKATGFPIAKIAAKLAVGYTLDEIANDITLKTPASFEPTIDYVVTKIPRFTFEKFPGADTTLGTQMKSVGEVMAIGRTFKESLQKAIRSLEIDVYGFQQSLDAGLSKDEILAKLRIPTPDRLWQIGDALRSGISIPEVYSASKIDPWFLDQVRQIIEMESEIVQPGWMDGPDCRDNLRKVKAMGFSDIRISELLNLKEDHVRDLRYKNGVRPVYKRVDTCAAEFEAHTPYLYSSYEDEDESGVTDKKKIMILGGGPNRIGQGIEFDYCCVHAAFTLRDKGYETIMVNCNPETVSTDYDTSDKLYFEPLTVEDVLSIYEKERPEGVIVQFGGQTPLNIANELAEAGVRILGTSPEAIDLAEDRDRFRQMMRELGIPMPESGMATNLEEALRIAERIGYPLMVRPSYVLGGRGMEVVYDAEMLKEYVAAAVDVTPDRPILIDRFLENAIEAEADAISDGTDTYVPAVMEHIELAGVHSGDSACVIPPVSLAGKHIDTIYDYTRKIARDLKVVGLMNIQYAIADDTVYVLEANPRASRTVPLVSKICNVNMVRIATQLMMGKKLSELNLKPRRIPHFGVKEAVFPFPMFPEVDPILGPEMRSTGEVLGIADSFGLAFFKAEEAAQQLLPTAGTVLITVSMDDRPAVSGVAGQFAALGFRIRATQGTRQFLASQGIESDLALKMHEGRPNIVDGIKNGEIQLVINTPSGKLSQYDDSYIRKAAIRYKVPYITTLAAAAAAAKGIAAYRQGKSGVRALQSYHADIG